MDFDFKKYYLDTNLLSEIASELYEKRDEFIWWGGVDGTQFQVKRKDDSGKWIGVNQELIAQDSLLKSIHGRARGELYLFKFPPNRMYNWHIDTTNLFNVNLIFEESPMGISLFKLEEGDYDKTTTHRSLSAVLPVKYTPMRWLIYNAQIPHTVLNLSDKTRYLLSYTIKKDISELTYTDLVTELEAAGVAGGT
jgi:hypothetical protein